MLNKFCPLRPRSLSSKVWLLRWKSKVNLGLVVHKGGDLWDHRAATYSSNPCHQSHPQLAATWAVDSHPNMDR